MNIKELIEVAKEKDPKFKKQIEHRLEKRQKAPEFDWLMGKLEAILGKDYIKKAAYAEMIRLQTADNTEEVG
jgi:hypothetical protein